MKGAVLAIKVSDIHISQVFAGQGIAPFATEKVSRRNSAAHLYSGAAPIVIKQCKASSSCFLYKCGNECDLRIQGFSLVNNDSKHFYNIACQSDAAQGLFDAAVVIIFCEMLSAQIPNISPHPQALSHHEELLQEESLICGDIQVEVVCVQEEGPRS